MTPGTRKGFYGYWSTDLGMDPSTTPGNTRDACRWHGVLVLPKKGASLTRPGTSGAGFGGQCTSAGYFLKSHWGAAERERAGEEQVS